MPAKDRYHEVLYPILEFYRAISDSDNTTTQIIVNQDKTRYLVINEGWIGTKRIHALIFDAEIRNGKIWLHHDGLDHGITDELIAAGIPKDQIVLAFHPTHIRPHTGYAVV
jgi:XisI protein